MPTQPQSILVVEDHDILQQLILEALAQRWPLAPHCRGVATLDEALGILRNPSEWPDMVVLDLNLPDSEGAATLDAVMDALPLIPEAPPVVVISGNIQVDEVLALMHGAAEFIDKGANDIIVRLQRSIRRAWARAQYWRTAGDPDANAE